MTHDHCGNHNMIYLITKVYHQEKTADTKIVIGYQNTIDEVKEFIAKNPLDPQGWQSYHVDEIKLASEYEEVLPSKEVLEYRQQILDSWIASMGLK